MVGPFIFFDHFGPAVFSAGKGIDVRPHPHIGLSTVTFLFDGEIMHRDSLGSAMPIHPGDVNLMTAGRGIVHSERTAPDHRVGGEPLHGLQCWLAMPDGDEEIDASFRASRRRPSFRSSAEDGKSVRVIARQRSTASARRSPTLSDTIFADATLAAGAALPIDAETEERALYIVVRRGRYRRRPLRRRAACWYCGRGDAITATAATDARVVLVGGAAMDGPRHIWWNFVSSRKERIEQAKADWKARRFDIVPGDESEFIPAAGVIEGGFRSPALAQCLQVGELLLDAADVSPGVAL